MDLLDELLPVTVAHAMSTAPPHGFELLGDENLPLAGMRAVRRAEYLNGRFCARRALAELGWPECPVPTTAERAPAWPDGVVGSISHCGQIAVAAVARRTAFAGLGLDIETATPLEADLMPILLTETEIAACASDAVGPGSGKLIFSAKESIYKCIWPSVRRFVDFREVEVRLDTASQLFYAASRSADATGLLTRLTGRFAYVDGWLATAAWIDV